MALGRVCRYFRCRQRKPHDFRHISRFRVCRAPSDATRLRDSRPDRRRPPASSSVFHVTRCVIEIGSHLKCLYSIEHFTVCTSLSDSPEKWATEWNTPPWPSQWQVQIFKKSTSFYLLITNAARNQQQTIVIANLLLHFYFSFTAPSIDNIKILFSKFFNYYLKFCWKFKKLDRKAIH